MLPFVIGNGRGVGEATEDGNVNLGLEIQSENDSIEPVQYLHVSNNQESSLAEFDNGRENSAVGNGNVCSINWQRRVGDTFLDNEVPTLIEERIRINQQVITMLEVNHNCPPPTTETLNITALNLRDPESINTESAKCYFRGLEMNEFADDDIRYVSWKRVIMKSRGLISISVLMMIIVIIVMAIFIVLVKHDHIPSHDSN